MKKLISVLLCLSVGLTATGLMTGCHRGPAHELRLWVYEPQSMEGEKQYRELIRGFTAKTGIPVTVGFVSKDGYRSKLDKALASGYGPDIAYLDDDWIKEYASPETGFVTPLNSYLRLSDVKSDRLFENVRRANAAETKILGIPLFAGCDVLLYNKAFVPLNEVPETWDGLLETAKAANGKGAAGFAGLDDEKYAARCFSALMVASEVKLTDKAVTKVRFSGPEGQKAAALLGQLKGLAADRQTADSGKSETSTGDKGSGKGEKSSGGENGSGKSGNASSEKESGDSGKGAGQSKESSSKEKESAGDAFGLGKAAFKIGDESDIAKLKKSFPDLSFGAARVPGPGKNGKGRAVLRATSLVLGKDAPRKTEAFKLIEFLTKPENAKRLTQFTGGISADMKLAEAEDPALSKVLELLPEAEPLPMLEGWNKVQETVLPAALGDIFAGRDPADALGEAADKAHELLWGKPRDKSPRPA